jgi:DNA-directed RNA polymerase subunit H (RpoH/RPB5)
MSLNIQMNDKEINQTIVENVLKLLERRKLLKSWEDEYNKLKSVLTSQTIFEVILEDKTKCGIYIINARLSSIVSGTPLANYLSNNLNVHKIIIIRDVLKKVVKQIIHEYKNAEFFFESEMLEDLPSKDFIPHHEIICDEEKTELLNKYSEKELSKILNTDIMCRYYGGKLGDIFKITRPSFTAGYSIFYRKVAPGSLDLLF